MLPPAFSHSQLDVFLTCLGLTRGPRLFWRQATGTSIYAAHIMGKQPQGQMLVSGVFQCCFSRLLVLGFRVQVTGNKKGHYRAGPAKLLRQMDA